MKVHKNPFGLDEVLQEILTDGPRGAILLSTSLIDLLLVGVLKNKMRELTNEEDDEMFYGNGPLSTFSAKIQLGYALNVYGKRTRHDLDALRKIRNPLAHSIENTDIDESLAKLKGFHCIQDDQGTMNARELLAEITKRLALYLIWNIDSPGDKGMEPNDEYKHMIRKLD